MRAYLCVRVRYLCVRTFACACGTFACVPLHTRAVPLRAYLCIRIVILKQPNLGSVTRSEQSQPGGTNSGNEFQLGQQWIAWTCWVCTRHSACQGIVDRPIPIACPAAHECAAFSCPLNRSMHHCFVVVRARVACACGHCFMHSRCERV